MTRLSISGLLSVDECLALIAAVERQGFEAMSERYPGGYRNNDRLVRDDAELAAWLWRRVEARLPALDGARPAGLNPRFRFCRYRDGQSFTLHRDGAWTKSPGQRSRLTLQVYLNEGFEGGETRFSEEGVAVRPVTGTAIVFDHRLWHDGAPVTRGTKYVLRTDVVYPLASPALLPAGGEGALREVERLTGHDGYVWQAIALSDGRIASCSRDGTVRVWPGGVVRRAAGSVTAVAEAGGELVSGTREEGVVSLAPLSDGRVMAGRTDGAVELEGRRMPLGAGWCWSVAELSPGRVAVGCEDGGVRVVDVAAWGVASVSRAPAPVRSVARLEGGGALAGLADGRLWVNGEVRAAHEAAATSVVEVSPGLWASASEDGTVALWDAATGARLGRGRHDDFVRSVARAGQDLVTASYDGTVRRWTIDNARVSPYLGRPVFPR